VSSPPDNGFYPQRLPVWLILRLFMLILANQVEYAFYVELEGHNIRNGEQLFGSVNTF
jgi:hypothetical protein